MDASVSLVAAACAAAVMLSTWVVSLPLRDASLADIVWGLAFVAIAWGAYLAGPGGPAPLLCALLVSAWGIRLSAYLAKRNLGHGEDRRYGSMRARAPRSFWLKSLATVFLLQGAIAWVVSLPVQSLAALPDDGVGALSWVGVGVFGIGLAFETIGDAQLAAFKRDPSSKGRVMDRGLWRYTRHPNYFGDSVVWWGLWLVAVGSGAGLWTLLGPAVMTFLLIRVSGVAMLESDIASRRPDYADYVRRTSAFLPRIPRGARR